MIRVLLVDDQSIIRQGLKALLELEPDLSVVADAENGQQAIEKLGTLQAEALTPDVVLMDIRMPVMDGVAATRAISQQYKGIKVLVLTTFNDDTYVSEAMKVGAMGYLLKDTPSEELAAAIRSVYKGYTQLGSGIFQKVIAKVPETPSGPFRFLPMGFAKLPPENRMYCV